MKMKKFFAIYLIYTMSCLFFMLNGMEKIVKIDKIIDLPDNRGYNLLFYAVKNNNYEMAIFILSQNADPNITFSLQEITPYILS